MAETMVGKERGAARWREIIQQQRQSGQSIHDFCRAGGLGESTFYAWRWRLGLSGEASGPSAGPPPAPPAAFVPVSVVSARSAGRLEILLPGGLRVRVTPPVDGPALAAVLAAVTTRSCGSEGQSC